VSLPYLCVIIFWSPASGSASARAQGFIFCVAGFGLLPPSLICSPPLGAQGHHACLRGWDLSGGPVNRLCARFFFSRFFVSASYLFSVEFILPGLIFVRVPSAQEIPSPGQARWLPRERRSGSVPSAWDFLDRDFSVLRPCVQSLCARSRDRFSLPCVFRFGLRSTVCAPISAVNFPTAKQSGFWSRAKGAHDSRFDFPLDVLRLSAEAVFVLSSRSCSWTALQTSGGGQWSVCFSLQTSSSRRLFFCSMSRVRLLFCSSCVLTDRSISRYCS
jgi:hypothetical protein